MEKQEYKDEHNKKKTSIEEPFEILKEQFHIEKEIIIGMVKTEEKINLDTLAYNLIRLHNIKQEIKKHKRRLKRLLRKHINKKPITTQNNNILKKKIKYPKKSI